MRCNEFIGRYSDYDDSLLPSRDEAAVRRHLQECDSCRRYDRVLRKGRMLARQVAGPEPSPDFLPRLQTRLQEIRRGPGARTPRLPAALAAVTVLVVAAAALMVLQGAPSAGAAVAGAGVADVAPAAMMGPADPAEFGPVHSIDGRVVALPAAVTVSPLDWTVGRVDPRQIASYSPFVTGPPAFRANRAWSYRSTHPTRRTLD